MVFFLSCVLLCKDLFTHAAGNFCLFRKSDWIIRICYSYSWQDLIFLQPLMKNQNLYVLSGALKLYKTTFFSWLIVCLLILLTTGKINCLDKDVWCHFMRVSTTMTSICQRSTPLPKVPCNVCWSYVDAIEAPKYQK